MGSLAAPASQITLIAAATRDRSVIGDGQRMPWHLPEDLAYFKATTMGHPMVMGRRTFDSMGALPGRASIVLSRTAAPTPRDQQPAVRWATSLEQALRLAAASPGGAEIFVVGGGQIYRAALPLADRILLTWVDQVIDLASPITFPEFEDGTSGDWRLHWREDHPGWSFTEYRRRD